MQKRVIVNRYDGLLESWKVRLIVSRAKRLGFRRHDLEDVQQELALDVIAFRYDPSKGAAEPTALTSMIDNRLKAIRRRSWRYAMRVTSAGDGPQLEVLLVDGQADLRLDVLTVMATLSATELAICLRLIQGQSVRQIARHLKRGWHWVDRIIKGIRGRFELMGL